MKISNILVTNKFFDLPEAYSLWSSGHIAQVLIMIGVLVGGWFLFRKKSNWLKPVLWALFAVALVTIGGLFVFCMTSGINNPEWYMPFHICNLFLFVLGFMCFTKGKVREFLYDYSFYFGLLGCIVAISFPGTTQLYFPSWHFVSVNVWVFHLVIGTLAVFLLSSGVYKIRFSNLWRMLAVFIPLIISAFILNSIWDTNFCFMNPSKFYYPLSMFAEYFGNYWTVILAGAIVAVSCVLMAMSFVVLTVKNKLVSMLISENPILIYIKENGLLDDTIDIVKNVLKNDAIKQYISSAKLVFDQEKFVSCWNVIKDDLSQMTVAQLEDMDYIFSLVKKSKILPVILEHVTIRNLKKLFNLAKTIPLGEIIKEISAISAPQQQLQLDAIGANA